MITKINDFKIFENNKREILLTEENKMLKEFIINKTGGKTPEEITESMWGIIKHSREMKHEHDTKLVHPVLNDKQEVIKFMLENIDLVNNCLYKTNMFETKMSAMGINSVDSFLIKAFEFLTVQLASDILDDMEEFGQVKYS